MTIIVNTPDTVAVQTIVNQSNTIVGAAQVGSIAPNKFVFFAAFDGTNNNKDDTRDANGNLRLTGDPQDTNVAQLFKQADQQKSSNLVAGYYAGPGGEPTNSNGLLTAVNANYYIQASAELAYNDFASAASDWLAKNPSGEITTALTAFSRGGATAAIFSQLVYERGLVDPKTGERLIQPGQVGVTAGVIYDPVLTGMNGNMAFAPNVQNIVVIRSENEYRIQFKPANYEGQPGITTIVMPGNHCDIGGGYDNGIAALTLRSATGFLQASGLSIADVDAGRAFVSSQTAIHSEAFTQVVLSSGEVILQPGVFNSYGSFAQGTQRLVSTSTVVQSPTTTTDADGRVESRFTDSRGNLFISTKKVNADNGINGGQTPIKIHIPKLTSQKPWPAFPV
jgi:Uncharacterized alpha/beta hydrolase domain (DUF2235)